MSLILKNSQGVFFAFVNFCHHEQQNNDINKSVHNRKTARVRDCSEIRDKANVKNKSIFLSLLTDLYARQTCLVSIVRVKYGTAELFSAPTAYFTLGTQYNLLQI